MGSDETFSPLQNVHSSFPKPVCQDHVRRLPCAFPGKNSGFGPSPGNCKQVFFDDDDFSVYPTNRQRLGQAQQVGSSRLRGCQNMPGQHLSRGQVPPQALHVPFLDGRLGGNVLVPSMTVSPGSRKMPMPRQTRLPGDSHSTHIDQQVPNFQPINHYTLPSPLSPNNDVFAALTKGIIRAQQIVPPLQNRPGLRENESHYNGHPLSPDQQLANAIRSLSINENGKGRSTMYGLPQLSDSLNCRSSQPHRSGFPCHRHSNTSSQSQSSTLLPSTSYRLLAASLSGSVDSLNEICQLSSTSSQDSASSSPCTPKAELSANKEGTCKPILLPHVMSSTRESHLYETIPSPELNNSHASSNDDEAVPSMLLFSDRRWKPTSNSAVSPDSASSLTQDDIDSFVFFDQHSSSSNSDQELLPCLRRGSFPPDVVVSKIGTRHQSSTQDYILPLQKVVAHCTWCGELAHKPSSIRSTMYSTKVFLGGVPWDITESILLSAFCIFGVSKVEWPGKEGKHRRHPPKGYVYLLFELEIGVKHLLSVCREDANGRYFFTVSNRRLRSNEVEVVPWNLADSNFTWYGPAHKIDPNKTVFMGGLHGLIGAENLGHIMNDLFGSVVYTGIDTDSHKYPIGSGRVTFASWSSYTKAVMAGFVEIKTNLFHKKVQINPYLEDSECSLCGAYSGSLFCRDQACFKYFCHQCWHWHHSVKWLRDHQPITRDHKRPAEITKLC